eukprot:6205179-Pleurochrysis_carterae.AAC.2
MVLSVCMEALKIKSGGRHAYEQVHASSRTRQIDLKSCMIDWQPRLIPDQAPLQLFHGRLPCSLPRPTAHSSVRTSADAQRRREKGVR